MYCITKKTLFKMRKNTLFILALAGYCSAFLFSCQHDNSELDISSIKEIFATPNSVAQGGTITLTVDVDPVGSPNFQWNASFGVLSDPLNDTTDWKAPDQAGIYVLSLVVTDDLGTNVGTINVGVDVYIPEVSPSYVGTANCTQCHSEISAEWSDTGPLSDGIASAYPGSGYRPV